MRLALFTASAALVLASAGTAGAQFNPHGRTKKTTPAPSAATPRPARAPRTTPKPNTEAAPAPSKPNEQTAAPKTPEPHDTAERRGGDREALIARYLGAALAQPGAEFPIQRLV